MGITVVGLGPGSGRYLTREAWEILSTAEEIYLRTERHPAVSDLPQTVHLVSFDHLYESASGFEDVYRQIVDEIAPVGPGIRTSSTLCLATLTLANQQ